MSSVPKRLRRESRPKVYEPSLDYMQNLPDDILLITFNNLSFHDLMRVQRVCGRFRRLVGDRSLWKDVNVSPCIISVKVLHKLLRRYFPKDMRSLKLRGYLNYYKGKPGFLKCILTNPFLKSLNERCPNLQTFGLLESSIPQSIHLSNFPNNLTKLHLRNCEFDSARTFFSKTTDLKLVASLRELDLSFSKGLSMASFAEIAKLENLQVLCLDGSETIRDREIQFFDGCLPKLKSLNLGHLTNITDSTLCLIANNFKDLRKLDIRKCNVTLKGILKMAESKQMLSHLGMPGKIYKKQMSLFKIFPALKLVYT